MLCTMACSVMHKQLLTSLNIVDSLRVKYLKVFSHSKLGVDNKAHQWVFSRLYQPSILSLDTEH